MIDNDSDIARLRALYRDLGEHAGPPPPFTVSSVEEPAQRSTWFRVVLTSTAALAVVAALAVAALFVSRSDPASRASTTVVPGDSVIVEVQSGTGPFTVTVADDAMVPTLLAGDLITATRNPHGHANAGDLTLIFNTAADGSNTTATGVDVSAIVRRIVAVGGDRVQLRNGVVYRNGHRETLTGYAGGPSTPQYRVPAGMIAVLPDDRTVYEPGTWWATPTTGAWTFATPTIRLATLHDTTGKPVYFTDTATATTPAASPAATANPVPVPHRYVVTATRAGYVQIEIPGQHPPNSTSWHPAKRVWVAADTVTTTEIRERVTINLATRQLHAIFPDGTTLTAPVAIGSPAAPTPKGRYQLIEIRRRTDTDVYGPGELRTTARSDTLTDYLGDNPYLIAIQGTNQPATIGKPVTHGNLRVTNTQWEQLAKLPLDTPITIR